MRGYLRRLLVTLVLLGILAPFAGPVRGAPRSSPTRSSSGVSVKIRGIDYLSVDELARRLEMKDAWLAPGKRVTLTGRGSRITFEVDSREAEVNGLRVVLGEAARMYRRSLYVSRIDAERYVSPMVGEFGRAKIPDIKVVALDAGHGGVDKGMVNKRLKLQEKDFTLDVVRRVEKLLTADGFKVVLTRKDDRYLEPLERPEIAQRLGADLFVSVHFNSVESGANRVTGVEVFAMTPQYQFSTDDPKRQGTAEARVLNPGNVHDVWNSAAAYHVQRQLVRDLKVADRGIKRARFAVLRMASCPAILVEGGYLSNDAEARKIATPAYRQDLAEAIAKGIRTYRSSLATERAKR